MSRYMKSMALTALVSVATMALLFQSSSPESWAQESSRAQIDYGVDEIPASALLTHRGRQLADELQNHRRTLSRLGSKHPTRKVIEEQIVAIKEELSAWSSVTDVQGDATLGENPFNPAANPRPQINETDLRQLVLRMSDRISALELRVQRLERARSARSQVPPR